MALRPLPAQPRRRGSRRLTARQAALLGLVQGPTEVLPLSSSGHLVLLPALLGWPYARADADVRKSFEVALHLGAGTALLWLLRRELRTNASDPVRTIALAGPAALAGATLEPVIEQRLSDPRLAAAAQIAGGLGLGVVDARASVARDAGATPRHTGDAVGLASIGLAQALALVPGVSRNGATLTAARALGMGRLNATRISWRAGLPVIAGACALKGFRLARRGLDRDLRTPFAVGAGAAFASTLASAPLLRATQRAWLPLAAYRVAVGALALRRLHRRPHSASPPSA